MSGLRIEYHLTYGAYFICECGSAPFMLRLCQENMYIKNNNGGALEFFCDHCGRTYNASEVLGFVAKWANKVSDKPIGGPDVPAA